MNELLESSIHVGDSCAELLREAALILWDEAPMANKAVLACINATLHKVTESHLPFGGKVFILLGNFCQTCPVVRGGHKVDIVDACLQQSPLWSLFHIWRLTVPVRNAQDLTFQSFIEDIGNGTTLTVLLASFCTVDNASHLIDYVYPPTILNRHDVCMHQSILAPTNEQIDWYNDAVLDCLCTAQRTYIASDSIKEMPDNDMPFPTPTLDYFTKRTPPGLPPYFLPYQGVQSLSSLKESIAL